jgi:mono/diheme cytochrome c family protein
LSLAGGAAPLVRTGMLRTALAALLALAPLSAGCSRSSGPPDQSQVVGSSNVSPADAEAHDIFDHVCAMCHGPNGRGDGPNGMSLNPRPRDYTDKAWQKTVTDDELRKAILEGGPAVGKSAAMPPNPNLRGKPEVVDALVKIVRSYGR